MNKEGRADLELMRKTLISMLKELDTKIIDFPPKASDELFNFTIKKAIYFRDIIKRIESQLNDK